MSDVLSAFKKLKEGKGKIIFLLGIAGILLIYLSSFLGNDDNSTTVSGGDITYEYCAQLEEKVEALVKGICGSKRVSVVVTLDSGKQYVYADEGRTQTTENGNDREQSYIIIEAADGEEGGLLVTEYMPTVRGVAVVCDGLTPQLEESICKAIAAALDISSKKIYVTQYLY